MELTFLDAKTLLTIGHVLGAVIGAGGAYASDLMFFASVRDRKLTAVELSFMRVGSKMVWVGLALLILTGLGIFSLNPEFYLSSSKFLVKMTIVAIITVNGLIFHLAHMPMFRRHSDHHFPSSSEFVRKSPYIMASGAISALSWTWALVLGVLRGLPYSYGQILVAYLMTIAIAIVVALIIRKRLLGLVV